MGFTPNWGCLITIIIRNIKRVLYIRNVGCYQYDLVHFLTPDTTYKFFTITLTLLPSNKGNGEKWKTT